MTHRIHYQDDIFFLSLKIKALRSGLNLDLDENLFLEQIHQEISFMAAVIENLYLELKQSSLILGKAEILKDIQRLKTGFIRLIDCVLDGKVHCSGALQLYFSEYERMRATFILNVEEIKNLISGINGRSHEIEYIVSEEELRYLLATDE